MLNMNVNINECTDVILNYSKDILDWLEEHKEKDISKDMVKQNLKELIDSSIEYSDVLCKDYIILNQKKQGKYEKILKNK